MSKETTKDYQSEFVDYCFSIGLRRRIKENYVSLHVSIETIVCLV